MAIVLVLMISAGFAEADSNEQPFVVGSLSQLSGAFFTDCWGNNTADMDVRALLHGYSTVTMYEDGIYGVDPKVSKAYISNYRTGKTYTFYLKRDLKYSDGTPITAKDYVFSVLLMSNPVMAELGGQNQNYAHLTGHEAYANGETNVFAGVRLLGDYRFSVTIDAEALPNFYELSLAAVTPYPMHVIAPGADVADDGEGAYITGTFDAATLTETVLDPETGYLSHPSVVSGPYTLASYENNVATFEKNDLYKGNYEGKKPQIETIVYKQVFNETLLAELESGEVDLVNKISSADVINAEDSEALESTMYPRNGFAYLAFATENEPVNSVAVRKAIAQSVNVQTICDTYLGGNAEPVYGYYGNGQWMVKRAGEKVEQLKVYTFDLEAAAKHLEDDGWAMAEGASVLSKDGVELVIDWVRPEVSEAADSVEALLTESFAQLGIGLNVHKMSYEELLGYYYRHSDRSEYDMFFLASNFGFTFNAYPVVCAAESYQGVHNTTAIDDETLTALAKTMNESRTRNEYIASWLEFQKQWNELMPMAPLYSNEYCDIYTADLEDYEIDKYWSWTEALLYADLK